MNEYISNPDEAREFQGRYRTLYIFIIFVISVFFLRLIWLQVISGNELRQYSEKNRIKQNKIFAPRGLILDREGKALIENLPGFEVLVSPQYIENIKFLAVIFPKSVYSSYSSSYIDIFFALINFFVCLKS